MIYHAALFFLAISSVIIKPETKCQKTSNNIINMIGMTTHRFVFAFRTQYAIS